MTVKDFLVANPGIIVKNANGKFDYNETTKCYDGSEDKILYLTLTRKYDNQDYLVLSHNAATKLRSGAITTNELAVSYSEEIKRWGIVMPSNVTKVEFA